MKMSIQYIYILMIYDIVYICLYKHLDEVDDIS